MAVSPMPVRRPHAASMSPPCPTATAGVTALPRPRSVCGVVKAPVPPPRRSATRTIARLQSLVDCTQAAATWPAAFTSTDGPQLPPVARNAAMVDGSANVPSERPKRTCRSTFGPQRFQEPTVPPSPTARVAA